MVLYYISCLFDEVLTDHSSPYFGEHLYDQLFSLVDYLPPSSLFLFLRFCLVLFFGTYSFVSLCPSVSTYLFCGLNRSVTTPSLEEVVLGQKYPMGPSSADSAGHPGHMSQGCPLRGLYALFYGWAAVGVNSLVCEVVL